MLKRLTQKVAYVLATTMFSLLEVLGLPKADRDEEEEESE